MTYMEYLYEHLDLLMYLRYHPKWYKILYYDPSYFKAFLKEAQTNLKIRPQDRLENFKNKFQTLYQLVNLLK
ncbi:MAG TPA: hypothetical protein IAD46_03015 [Candidatus Pelethenecus faecipullorum]|uniref:YlbE-like protein n=1 Tax=Candidatus Pelethenecus faecipullorum TaxID=2840900 RepID=A0A9D1GQE2_9MOLU|nr:hypothetical protein [Candidatus Pelethenecus faecipullorum]